MKSRIILIVALAFAWGVLIFIGYKLSQLGEWLIGTDSMMVAASIVATISLVMLFGQYLAGTADYFLSIDNPRPLDEEEDLITIKGWGFATQASRSCTAELAGQGFADIRLYADRRQVLASLATFGFTRPVKVAWRGNAGQHPLGEA